jgi:NAD(P)H-hydrate repair Nnr-like enzyme with NAD(P)H-hydrate dehydratase domain
MKWRNAKALQARDVLALWPKPGVDDDKYSRGVVGIDSGSERFPGAAVLNVLGALWSGAGFIRYVGTPAAKPALLLQAPSITYGGGRVQAWCLGSGWDEAEDNVARLQMRLKDGVPCVLDAAALLLLRDGAFGKLPDGSLLTPHVGELARLLAVKPEQVKEHPAEYALQAAKATGATVLLKGALQYAAAPDGAVLRALRGPAWTAQAGSGDVLAGICATLLAAGIEALLAGALAASIQAMMALEHPGPIPPDALLRYLPETITAS